MVAGAAALAAATAFRSSSSSSSTVPQLKRRQTASFVSTTTINLRVVLVPILLLLGSMLCASVRPASRLPGSPGWRMPIPVAQGFLWTGSTTRTTIARVARRRRCFDSRRNESSPSRGNRRSMLLPHGHGSPIDNHHRFLATTTTNDENGDESKGVDAKNIASVHDVVESILERASSSPSGNDGESNNVSPLFQSMLRRARSTTATVANHRVGRGDNNGGDAAAGTEPPSESTGAVASALGSILDAIVVEREPSSAATESSNAASREGMASAVRSVVNATISSTRDTVAAREPTRSLIPDHAAGATTPPSPGAGSFPRAASYKSHPALNNVALAHALWASVVRPRTDTLIDATCGNGNDSVVLAGLLWPSGGGKYDQYNSGGEPFSGELLCVDLQSTACERTTQALGEVLPPSIPIHVNDEGLLPPPDEGETSSGGSRVRVLQASHQRLPRPTDDSSVGLIVYNLGWLPGSTSDGKDCVTTMDTTIDSLVDATSLLRVGGMLSVMTYPQNGPDEDEAVRLFLQCLALLSSKTQTWSDAVASFAARGNGDGNGADREAIASKVTTAMETVVANGDPATWRVSQHDFLGMNRPPILLTATRIK